MSDDKRLVQVPVDVLHALYDCWFAYRMWYESNPAPDDEKGNKRVLVYQDFIDEIEKSMAFFEPHAEVVWGMITGRLTKEVLDAAVNKLRDQKLLEREDLRESIEQMRRGEGRVVDVAEIRRRYMTCPTCKKAENVWCSNGYHFGSRPAPTNIDWIQMEEQ